MRISVFFLFCCWRFFCVLAFGSIPNVVGIADVANVPAVADGPSFVGVLTVTCEIAFADVFLLLFTLYRRWFSCWYIVPSILASMLLLVSLLSFFLLFIRPRFAYVRVGVDQITTERAMSFQFVSKLLSGPSCFLLVHCMRSWFLLVRCSSSNKVF